MDAILLPLSMSRVAMHDNKVHLRPALIQCLEQTCDSGLLDLHGAQAAEVLCLLQVIGILACLGSLLCRLPLLSLL